MLTNRYIQVMLVGGQFAGIIYFLISGNIFPDGVFISVIYIFAVLLGLSAIFSMNFRTINVFPEVRKNAELTKKGPYRLIRHPMYTAVIILPSGFLLNEFTVLRFVVYCFVILDLMIKINVEEKILSEKYPLYKNYISKTKKLIPYIY